MTSRTLTPLIIGVLGVAYAAWMLLHGSLVAVMEPDSASYLNFAPVRTSGYPLFLRLVGLDRLVLVQSLSYDAAVCWLGATVFQRFGRGPLAVLLVVALFANPELSKYHAHVMTESLFMTALVIFLGAAIRFVTQPRLAPLMLAAVVVALAVPLRPPAVALIPILFGMILARRQAFAGKLALVTVIALLPIAVSFAADRAYATAVHGSTQTSLAGRHFFAKAALLDAPFAPQGEPADSVPGRLAAAMDHDFAPIRSLLHDAPTQAARSLLLVNYETCAEYACADPLRAGDAAAQAATDHAMLELATARIRQYPLAYLRLSWSHFYGMWSLFPITTPYIAEPIEHYVADHSPLPQGDLLPPLLSDHHSPLALVARLAVQALGVLTGALMVAGVVMLSTGRGQAELMTAALAGTTVQVTLLLVCLTGVGIPRYTISLWPAIMLAGVMVLHIVADMLHLHRPPIRRS